MSIQDLRVSIQMNFLFYLLRSISDLNSINFYINRYRANNYGGRKSHVAASNLTSKYGNKPSSGISRSTGVSNAGSSSASSHSNNVFRTAQEELVCSQPLIWFPHDINFGLKIKIEN